MYCIHSLLQLSYCFDAIHTLCIFDERDREFFHRLTLAATLKDDTTDKKLTIKRQTKYQPFAK
jgi:hypothetical protein